MLHITVLRWAPHDIIHFSQASPQYNDQPSATAAFNYTCSVSLQFPGQTTLILSLIQTSVYQGFGQPAEIRCLLEVQGVNKGVCNSIFKQTTNIWLQVSQTTYYYSVFSLCW